MRETKEQDVVAPRAALAWAAGTTSTPGRWLYHEADVADAQRRGEHIRRTETAAGRTWLRGVAGNAPLADVIRLTTAVDDLRITLLDLMETATHALASPDDD